MLFIGCIFFVFTGILLRLVGSGGSILTIPILVYLLKVEPQNATVYSLFIVGLVSLLGSLESFKKRVIDVKIALLFGLPSILSIVAMRQVINPLIPSIILELDDFILTKNILIMLVFAVLMILASYIMICPIKTDAYYVKKTNFHLPIQGSIIGLLTGFVGVGGGFLIIPALLFNAHLPMNKAIATSLIIISANSLLGFTASAFSVQIEWTMLLSFTCLATIGVIIGSIISGKISNEKLKPAFGWFVLISGIFIIIKEISIS
ncbi:MAG: sulfite exporter TauE/SafE family protein [Leadbetterella sp.]